MEVSAQQPHVGNVEAVLTSDLRMVSDTRDRSIAPIAPQLARVGPDDPRWRDFAPHAEMAGPFHHPQWMFALAETYGHRPSALVLERDGRVVAGLPLLEVRSRLTGHRLVSLPFTDHCAPLAVDGQAEVLLARHLAAWQAQTGVPLEVRGALGGPGSGQVHTRTAGVNHQLELQQDAQSQRAALPAAVRRAIAKAERAGLVARLGTGRDDVATYYRLHRLTRHRQGVPVQPWRLFDRIWANMVEKDLGTVVTVADQGRVVASALFLLWNGVAVYKYGASDPACWHLRPNNLVLWKGIEWAIQRGARIFDFGRSDIDHHGLREFKRRFGADETTLTYTTLGPHAPRDGSHRLMGSAAPLIRRSPELLNRFLGWALYPHVA